MPEQRIIGRVRGKQLAPDTFEDALEQVLGEQGALVAGLHQVGSMTRFGKPGTLVRISDLLDLVLHALQTGDGDMDREALAEAMCQQAIALLMMERGLWALPERSNLSADDEEPEFLREH